MTTKPILLVEDTPDDAELTIMSLKHATPDLVVCEIRMPGTDGFCVQAKHEPGSWKIVVADRGQGMPPQQIRDIGAFKQFWSGAERPHGLGIGLVLVQALARLHSGEVLMESDPVAGTRVTVMIPSE